MVRPYALSINMITIWMSAKLACPGLLKAFYQIFIFHQMIAFQKLLKNVFLFNLKSSFRSQDIKIFVIFSFPFLSTLSRFKRTYESGIIYDVMN